MEVKNKQNDTKGNFYIEENGSTIAELEYVYAGPDKIIINHTEVNTGQEGKGLGKLLVKAAIDFARAKHLKIMPLCPYAKSIFDKSDEYNDVLF